MILLESVGHGFCPKCLTINPLLHDMGGAQYFNEEYADSIFDVENDEFWLLMSHEDFLQVKKAIMRQATVQLLADIFGEEIGNSRITTKSEDGVISEISHYDEDGKDLVQHLSLSFGQGGLGQFFLIVYDHVSDVCLVEDLNKAHSTKD